MAVRSATGVDFSQYRDTTIRRRIGRRMALHGKPAMAEYVKLLEGDRAEIEALYRDLLINVTSFFRDPEMFEELKRRVFPAILEGKSHEDAIRVWVPGCSTGQEAYSLAMALVEFLDDRPVAPRIQIFATDLNDPATSRRPAPASTRRASKRRCPRSACAASSCARTTSTGSTRRSATCASSRGRTSPPTRRSRTST